MKETLKRILPEPALDALKRSKSNAYAGLRRGAEMVGLNVVRRDDYSSPLPVGSELRRNVARWNRPSELLGVEYDLEAMKTRLSRLVEAYGDELSTLPSYQEIMGKGFGHGYPLVDALTQYLMLRDLKPAHYLEVGSGMSTYCCSLAARKNAEDHAPMQIECIEPYPFEQLRALPGIRLRVDEVQNVAPSVFQALQENDVLFIDSSHTLKIDSDVAYLFLEILPSLRKGVIVHVHDIPFPYNFPYPSEFWMTGKKLPGNWPSYWNEAMVLQALLSGSDQFEILLSTPLLRYYDESFLRETLPIYTPLEEEPNTFSAIWLRKRA